MGGEKINWKKLIAVCGSKAKNEVAFTHWDLDHISFAEQASRRLSGFCISVPPRGTATPEKLEVFSKFRICSDPSKGISELKFAPIGKKINANDMSRIYLGQSTLFPGDSTAKQERIWSRLISTHRLKFLVLGHHGSKTSTSVKLLKNLPHLRLAIASSRKKRYGHPHRTVVENLTAQGVSTLSTEQWNDVVFELK